MKYNHNANIELKTGRNRSYTTTQRDDDKNDIYMKYIFY